ncbi:MAG: hypothetical protein VB144_07720 [Clostridia bacterium]|nr:hypothetical protein [Clostridia bacterium]
MLIIYRKRGTENQLRGQKDSHERYLKNSPDYELVGICAEGEVLLTLISPVAENVKWGKRRRYEQGDIRSFSGKPCFGYDKAADGVPTTNGGRE